MTKRKNIKKGSTTKKSKRNQSSSKNVYESKLVFREITTEKDELYKKIFKGLAAFVLVVTVALALGSGMNGDDSFQNDYSVKIIDFYTSMGADTSCFKHPKGPIQYYGGLFELSSGIINSTLGLTPDDHAYHDVRHVWNALFGFFAMLFIGLLAKEIGGWRAGILALGMAFLSPRFLGHSLMNPKDIPFAMGYIMSIYYLARLIKQLPKPDKTTLWGLAGGIGIAFGMRVGGLLIPAYVVMFVGLAFLLRYGFGGLTSKPKELGKYVAYAAIPSLVGLIFGVLVWPYALVDPFNHIPETLKEFSKLSVNIRSLFEGVMVFGGDVPSNYLPKWVGMTIPVFSIVGIILFFTFIKKIFQKHTPLLTFMAIFVGLFPFIYVMIQGSTLHDGWRHTIFAYTGIVVSSALAWNYVLDAFKTNKTITYVVAGALTLMALEPAVFIIRNHHYPNLYFNALSGGINGAYGSYETDYWGVSLKQAIDWMGQEGIISTDLEEPITIVSNFSYNLNKYINKTYQGKVKTGYTRYRQRYDKQWDYALFLTRFVRGTHIKEGIYPPESSVIHTIESNGVPLVVILKNDDDLIFNGVQASKKQNWSEAYAALIQETAKHPDNEIAWTELARSCVNLNKFPEAKNAIDKVLSIEPDNLQAHNLLGNYYSLTGDLNKAEATFYKTFEFEPKNSVGYYYLATIKQQRDNDTAGAIELANKSIQVNPRFKQGYALCALLYEQSGDLEKAKLYRDAMAKVR
jgi:hypothetical protein